MRPFARSLCFVLAAAIAGCSSSASLLPGANDPGAQGVLFERSSAGGAFAPYVDLTSWPPYQVAPYAKATGTRSFTLAFVQSYQHGRCEGAWGGTVLPADPTNGPYYAQQVAAARKLGGEAIISFGGAAGQDLAFDCADAASLATAYEAIVDYYHVRYLDFDIEGAAPYDAASVARRSQALAAVQQHYAATTPVSISYTLPVEPQGLNNPVLGVVKSAMQAGLKLSIVNIMTMDFGNDPAPHPSGRMATYAIESAKSAAAQLKKIGFPLGTNPYASIGITPMIGQNDTADEIFALADAAQLVTWAKSSGVGRLAFWAAQRDKSCPGGPNRHASDTCSGITQPAGAFGAAFAGL